jgi:flagellin-specific chaperone FliS
MTNPYARQAREYRYQEVMNASPVRLIIITYDVAITACQQGDLNRTTQALSVLRNSLDFKYSEVSNRLFALYLWCADLARTGKWDEAVKILSELRESWIQAEHAMAASQVHPTVSSMPVQLQSAMVAM